MTIKQISYCAILTALVAITTMFLSFPIGSFGYLNLGDVVIMIGATIFGPVTSFVFGGVGSAIADLFVGYSQYAIFTLIIKGLECFLFSYLYKKNKKIIAYLLVGFVLLVGYGIADVILVGEWSVMIPSMAVNSVQVISAILVTILLLPVIGNRLRKQINESK